MCDLWARIFYFLLILHHSREGHWMTLCRNYEFWEQNQTNSWSRGCFEILLFKIEHFNLEYKWGFDILTGTVFKLRNTQERVENQQILPLNCTPLGSFIFKMNCAGKCAIINITWYFLFTIFPINDLYKPNVHFTLRGGLERKRNACYKDLWEWLLTINPDSFRHSVYSYRVNGRSWTKQTIQEMECKPGEDKCCRNQT